MKDDEARLHQAEQDEIVRPYADQALREGRYLGKTWFRLYDEVVDDPKVQLLPDHLFKAWINCMCLASKNAKCRGSLPDLQAVAYRLHLLCEEAEHLIAQLVNAGLFDWKDAIAYSHNWNNRQFESDRSGATDQVNRAQQMREHRKHTLEWNGLKKNRAVTILTPFGQYSQQVVPRDNFVPSRYADTEYRVQSTETDPESETDPSPEHECVNENLYLHPPSRAEARVAVADNPKNQTANADSVEAEDLDHRPEVRSQRHGQVSGTSRTDAPLAKPYGEFGRVHLSEAQYANLQATCGSCADELIAELDGWIEEAPEAKVNGVKRKDRNALATMKNWFRRKLAKGELNRNGQQRRQDFETKGEALIRKQKEQSQRFHRAFRGSTGDGLWPSDSDGADGDIRSGPERSN